MAETAVDRQRNSFAFSLEIIATSVCNLRAYSEHAN